MLNGACIALVGLCFLLGSLSLEVQLVGGVGAKCT